MRPSVRPPVRAFPPCIPSLHSLTQPCCAPAADIAVLQQQEARADGALAAVRAAVAAGRRRLEAAQEVLALQQGAAEQRMVCEAMEQEAAALRARVTDLQEKSRAAQAEAAEVRAPAHDHRRACVPHPAAVRLASHRSLHECWQQRRQPRRRKPWRGRRSKRRTCGPRWPRCRRAPCGSWRRPAAPPSNCAWPTRGRCRGTPLCAYCWASHARMAARQPPAGCHMASPAPFRGQWAGCACRRLGS